MKKLLALTLVFVMLFTLVACGNANTPEDTSTPTDTSTPEGTSNPADTSTSETPVVLPYTNAAELLQIVFDKYNAAQPTDDTMLWVCGGNVNNFDTCNPEGPAAFIPVDNEDYNANLGIPVAEADKIASAASMFNMMNANTFNCFSVQLNDGVDADAFIATLKDNILARQWICGSPDKLVIAKAPGNYIIAVWGVVEFGGLVDPVAESFSTNIEGAQIVVEENIAR